MIIALTRTLSSSRKVSRKALILFSASCAMLRALIPSWGAIPAWALLPINFTLFDINPLVSVSTVQHFLPPSTSIMWHCRIISTWSIPPLKRYSCFPP